MKYEPRFYLDNPKLKETFVIMAVTASNGRLKWSTGLKIDPAKWREDIKDLNPGHLKNMITELKTLIITYKSLYRAGGEIHAISKEDLKLNLDNKYNRTSKATKPRVNTGSFAVDAEKIIDLMRKGEIKNPKTGTGYANNSVVSMENTKDSLLAFAKEKGMSISFEDTDEETFKSYVNWMNEQGYRLSSLNTRIGYWKGLAFHVRNTLKVKINVWFDNTRFKISSAKIEGKVSLNDEDIEKLMKLDLSGADAEIRDRFVINLYNGLRISDMSRLTENNIENGQINLITQKKNKEIAQPLAKPVKEIIARYDGKLPKAFDESHINKRIKDICKLAEINDTIIYSEVVGGVLVTQKKKKYELITNHTARRTATTNMRKSGIDTLDLNHILAMSPTTVQRYDKVTAKETANKVKNNSFFN